MEGVYTNWQTTGDTAYLKQWPEDPYPAHIKSDPLNAIGLSNTYSMNRGTATPEMAASIIETYRQIGEKTKNESLAPWFGIYPFIYPHFGNYAVGEYMNGAILPLVGGELCKAAFQYGYEKFAIEQLDILEKIVQINGGRIPGCANGDGTAQKEAIPAEWGQAAFISALVEGLAGVVDKGVQFRIIYTAVSNARKSKNRIGIHQWQTGSGNYRTS